MQTKNAHTHTHNPQGCSPTAHAQTNTYTHEKNTLIYTHLTWIETTGWQLSLLTGSIRGQSAAEPHAVQPQRDTLDYRETARHTTEEARGVGVVGRIGRGVGGRGWIRGAG